MRAAHPTQMARLGSTHYNISRCVEVVSEGDHNASPPARESQVVGPTFSPRPGVRATPEFTIHIYYPPAPTLQKRRLLPKDAWACIAWKAICNQIFMLVSEESVAGVILVSIEADVLPLNYSRPESSAWTRDRLLHGKMTSKVSLSRRPMAMRSENPGSGPDLPWYHRQFDHAAARKRRLRCVRRALSDNHRYVRSAS